MYLVKLTGTLRVSKEGELEGLDLHEHGGTAYPELIGAGSSAPAPHTSGGVIAPAAAE
jgi:Amt family ammonium transporter